MERILEPELMDDALHAEAYAIADFAEVNQAFVDRFRAEFPELVAGEILDLGCGPADIPLRLCRALPKVAVTAVDGAPAMLEHAQKVIDAAQLSHRIEVVCGRVPGAVRKGRRFDAVVSNSLLHHLPDAAALWREIRRTGRPGAPVLVMDLFRPATPEEARRLVDTYAANERALLRDDFFASLCAAFTPDEVAEQVEAFGLGEALVVEVIDDRHLLVRGRLP